MMTVSADFEIARNGKVTDYPFSHIHQNDMSTIFHQVSPLGDSLLHAAASAGNVDITTRIATFFPHLIKTKNDQGDTPLHVAARAGKFKTVDILVQYLPSCPPASHDIDSRLINEKGNSPLHEALLALMHSKNREAIISVRRLASMDPELCYLQNRAEKSPMCMAVESENTEVLEYILKVAPEDPLRKPEGKSPAHVAIELENKDALRIINECKPELLRMVDGKDNTPLHIAASVGYMEGVKFLLDANGEQALQKNKGELYPLYLAIAYGHVEAVQQLLNYSAKWRDPSEFLDGKGKNILHVAVEFGRIDMVRWILTQPETHALTNQVDDEGNTALHLAAMHGYSVIVKILLQDKRKNTNIKNHRGLTPHRIAAKQAELLDAAKKPAKILNYTDDSEIIILSKHTLSDQLQESRQTSAFRTMSTLSLLFMHHLVEEVRKKEWKKVFSGISKHTHMTIKTQRREDVKDKVNSLLVVAALLIGVAYASPTQMPVGINRTEQLTWSSYMFLLCDGVAFMMSVVASFFLCWSQLLDVDLASVTVWFAFQMLGLALSFLGLAFLASVYTWVPLVTFVISALFAVLLIAMDFLFLVMLLLPNTVMEFFILCLYFFYFQTYYLLFKSRSSYHDRPDHNLLELEKNEATTEGQLIPTGM